MVGYRPAVAGGEPPVGDGIGRWALVDGRRSIGVETMCSSSPPQWFTRLRTTRNSHIGTVKISISRCFRCNGHILGFKSTLTCLVNHVLCIEGYFEQRVVVNTLLINYVISVHS